MERLIRDRCGVNRRDLLRWAAVLGGGWAAGPLSRLSAAWAGQHVAPRDPGVAAQTGPRALRAVSLRALQEQGQEHRQAGIVRTEDLEFFGQLTVLRALVIDRTVPDTIIVGEASPDPPRIPTSDFASAVRGARGLPRIPPGMSLDPPVEGGPGSREPEACPGAYVVRLINLAHDENLTRILIVADGKMKQVADATLAVSGLESYWDLQFRVLRQAAAQCGTQVPGQTTLNRFWFHPSEPKFELGEDVVLFRQWGVQLLTERDSVERRGAGPAHSLGVDQVAREFCEAVTTNYDRLAAAFPDVYEALRTCFRLVALVEVIKYLGAPLDWDYWLYRHQIARVATPRTWPRQVREGGLSCQRTARPYVYRYQYRQKLCGGVSMAYRIAPGHFAPAPTGTWSHVRSAVLSTRPSPSAAAWDAPVRLTA